MHLLLYAFVSMLTDVGSGPADMGACTVDVSVVTDMDAMMVDGETALSPL